MAIPTFIKDPDEILDYGFDLEDWLASGEIPDVVTWTVPTGLTEGSHVKSATQIKVWLSGGTAGETYRVEADFTTTDGRKGSRSFDIRVRDR